MIVPMKKTTVICLKSEREKTVARLQELGLMHVEIIKKPADSEDRTLLSRQQVELDRALGVLASRKVGENCSADLSDEELKDKLLALVAENSELKQDIERLKREYENFLPWGDFSGQLLRKLTDNGVFVYLCVGTHRDIEALPNGIETRIISEDKNKVHFVIVTREEFDWSQYNLNIVNLPEELSLSQIEQNLAEKKKQLEENEAALDVLAADAARLSKIMVRLKDDLEFLTNRDSMAGSGELLYLRGYVPEPQFDKLREAAVTNGWALHYEDADLADHNVPTLLKIPRAFRVIEPMLEFLGISPGYGEVDVSVCFLLFLTIFFGMILGDGGYGAVFLILALVLRFSIKAPSLHRPLKLLMTFSISTLIWGSLTGNFFGITTPDRPWFMKGIHFFTDPAVKDKNIQLFCFILAVMHLTTGRLWRAFLYRTSFAKMLGEVGWAVVLWGNFFVTLKLLVFPGAIENYILWIYAVGFALVILFGVNWRDAGEAFNFPFGAIGTFVDILSYIRLYAVGMSGFYIANSFNGMGVNVFHISSSPWLIPFLVIGGVVVIAFGHLLNIALCLMGVLVHGVRLNTLEFSNHIGLRWAGRQFKPFARTEEQIIDSK